MELYSNHGAVPSVFSPFPEMPSPNFSTNSLSIMQANTNPAAPAGQNVGLCCHCGRGLPYDTYHIFCLFCDLNICADCHRTHPAAHQPYFKYLLDRKIPRGSRASPAYCTKCKHPSHSGLSCNDCEFSICVNCVPTSRDLLANHPHGKLTMTRAPDDFGLGMYSLQCNSCQAGATLSHCGRCLNGIRKGQNFWTCVTCIVDYNAQIRFCSDCQAPGTREHDPTHRFSSFLYRVDINKDPKYNTVKCLDCKSHVPFSGRELARHPHSRFQLVMGEAERDRRYFQSYRTCARKPVRDLATISAEAHDILCGCCNHKITLNAKVLMCPTCTMITCETCAESGGARSHPHIMIPVFLERTIPFALLGQTMARPDRTPKHCAKCDNLVNPDSDSFIQCNHCEEHVICLSCTKRTNMPVRHACSEAVEMTFFDPLKQANNMIIAKILTAQKAKAAAAALKQQQSALQPSFSIKRKNPSITSHSSTSSVSPITPMAQMTELSQFPTTPPPISQLAMNQQLAQLSAGLGAAGLPLQQSSLPSIQPDIQRPIYNQEVRRKSLQPALKNASKAMLDGSASASKAAYNKASNMVENIDKDSMKKVGKKMAAIAGALGGQAVRDYVRQETGVIIPRVRPNQRPNQTNQQAQLMNAQLQNGMQDINKLNALNAQLQMKQKILQLQNQVALQQQQQQQAQNQAAIQAGATAMPIAASVLGQTQPATPQMTPSIPSTQGMVASGILHQPTPIAVGGTYSVPHAIAGASTPSPYSSNLNSAAPTPLSEPNNTLGAPGYNSSNMAPSQVNVASSVDGLDPNQMAPIPASELQWASGVGLSSSHMAPIPPSEAIAAPSIHSVDSEMAPIPASELNSFPGTANNSMAPIPPSEAEMAPIPPSEQNAFPHPNGNDSSHPASDHDMAPIPPSEQSASNHVDPETNSSHNAGGNTQQTTSPAGQSQSPPHDSDHHSNYHQPSVEDGPENETPQSATNATPSGQPTENHGPGTSHPDGYFPGSQHDSQAAHSHPHGHQSHDSHLPGTHYDSQAAYNHPHAQQPYDSYSVNSHADQGGHQSHHQSPSTHANNQPFSSPPTPTPSHGGYQQFTPQSGNTPNIHGAPPSLHPLTGSQHQPFPSTSSSPAPTSQPQYASSPSPHPQTHGPLSYVQQPPNQNNSLPARPPISGGGQADEYYQTHPLNQGGTPGGPSTVNNINYQQQQQQNVSYNQTSSPSLPPQNPITAMMGNSQSPQPQNVAPSVASSTPQPGHPQPQNPIPVALPGAPAMSTPQPGLTQPQNPITGILTGATPATASSTQASQININVQAGGPGGAAQGDGSASYNQAQMQQQLNMNMQNQQLQALEQRLQMMNLQQQQQSQLLANQLQGQGQQGSQHPLLETGLFIINNLTQNSNNNNMNSLLQQQQQQQQQQLNLLNQLTAQSQLNAETMALNDQAQANLELQQLNAQLASLQNMSGMNDVAFTNNSLDVVDVNNYNVNIDIDQSVNMQSNSDFGFDMTSSTDIGFGMTDTSAFVSETSFAEVDIEY